MVGIISALLFGAATPASKLLLNDVNINPIILASLYYLGAALFLFPFSMSQFTREIKHLKSDKKDFYRIIGAIIFGGIIGPICLLFGIKLMDATSASLLLNFESVATAFLGWLLFKEHISGKVVVSSFLTLVAGVLLVLNQDFSINWGGVLIGLACLSWGFDNNFTATVEGLTPATNTIIKGLAAGLFNFILAWLYYDLNIELINVIYALLVGGFSYGLSISLYISSARYLGATRAQIVFAINPFLGLLLSYFIFNDLLDLKFFFALSVMIIAVIILYIERHVHLHEHLELEHEHEHTHDDDHHSHSHPGLPAKTKHIHRHYHTALTHSHLHYPDIHHKHRH